MRFTVLLNGGPAPPRPGWQPGGGPTGGAPGWVGPAQARQAAAWDPAAPRPAGQTLGFQPDLAGPPTDHLTPAGKGASRGALVPVEPKPNRHPDQPQPTDRNQPTKHQPPVDKEVIALEVATVDQPAVAHAAAGHEAGPGPSREGQALQLGPGDGPESSQLQGGDGCQWDGVCGPAPSMSMNIVPNVSGLPFSRWTWNPQNPQDSNPQRLSPCPRPSSRRTTDVWECPNMLEGPPCPAG